MERRVLAGVAATAAVLIVAPALARWGMWPGLVAAAAAIAGARWMAAALPAALDGAARRRPVIAGLWVLLALIALAQVGRLSAFMGDVSRTWGSAFPDPDTERHMCLSAYVHAADLSRRGEPNLYDERFYPAFHGDGKPGGESPVENLGPYLEDPYEYPPPFLLLPRAALAVTNDFFAIRTAWFVVQALALPAAALALAAWVGGRAGLIAGLLAPALLASLPTMLDLQFGQFHVAAVLLAVGAMVAFESRRAALGGALLAAAVAAKIFPALLLVPLVARRRWREVAWTAGCGALYCGVALAVLGAAPFRAFVSYQLPRMASGEAFAFFERDLFFVSRNHSIYGIVIKLHTLGVPGMTHGLAAALAWIYTALLLWLAWRAARGERSRLGLALMWLALLDLGALRSPLAPSSYVVVPTLWLLTLRAGEVRGWMRTIAFVVAWALVMGPPPLPDTAELIVGLVAQAVAIAINVWCLSSARRQAV